MTSSAQTPEPTAEQMQTAREVYAEMGGRSLIVHQIDILARALAAAVTAEREKYLRVAGEHDQDEQRFLDYASWGGNDETRHRAIADTHKRAARRIREVSR